MSYDLPSDFHERLSSKFDAAVKSKSLVFSEDLKTKLIHHSFGKSVVDFQTTLLPSLTDRPPHGTIEANPFASPEPELTILDSYGTQDEFKIVFNKFPVVPNHFMVLTKEFKPQATPLSSTELKATFAILTALQSHKKDEQWFAFYNSGPQSGASQPHKHIQFMTLPNGFVPYAEKLAYTSDPFLPNARDEPLQNGDIPFAHFVARLPEISEIEDDDLTAFFVSLLQRTLTVLRGNGAKHISYNFIFTTKYMLMVPRSSNNYKGVGVNSCGIFGLVLCKDQESLDIVNSEGAQVILERVGFPSTAGIKGEEHDY